MRAEETPSVLIPSHPGTYVLIMRLASMVEITVGRLGASHYAAGWYAYVGSARGPGGLAARLNRHRRRRKRLHWHIDYLLSVSDLTEMWWVISPQRWECTWAKALSRLAEATIPVPGFGASDCRCQAHLVHFRHRPASAALATQLETRCPLCLTVLMAARA
jgi:Uri superfamily endonuclease